MPKRATVTAAMKSPAERGVTGAWAYEARAEADLSVPEVVAALASKGYKVTEPTIRGVEGGSKRPSRRLLRMLAEVYGKPVPGEPEVEADGMAALVTAIGALVEEMRLTRQEQAAWNRGVTEALALLAGRLPGPAPTDDPAPAPLAGARR